MSTPKIKIEINKGKEGVELEKLSGLAKETFKFLVSLSVDLSDPDSEWIADNFQNGSLIFELHKRHDARTDIQIWNDALDAVMENSFANEALNVRIRPETRMQYFNIAKALPEGDAVSFGVVRNGDAPETVTWHRLDKTAALVASEVVATPRMAHYGEIQGIVHSFFKETKHPKLVIRELSTKALVDCFFTEQLYEHAVALLQDKDGVVFVEGTVSEDETGNITSIHVADFTPAPPFDEREFESMIGTFPGALTGNQDSQEALDNYRE